MACELACAGQGREALPSPLRDPLFLPCARAVSPRPAFGVCRLMAATPHLVYSKPKKPLVLKLRRKINTPEIQQLKAFWARGTLGPQTLNLCHF